MKNLKKGITIAELLVTLAIVGIISVITLPTMINSVNGKVNGASIGRGVVLVEQGIMNIFESAQKHDVISNNLASLTLEDVYGKDASLGEGVVLTNYIASGDNLFKYAGKFTGTVRGNNGYLANIVAYNGNANAINNANVYKFKKAKINLIVGTIAAIDDDDANDNDKVLTRIYVDGNGDNPPNKLGVDIFLFGLSNRGKMIPAGVPAYNNNIFNETISLYTDANTGCMGTITDGLPCAARIARDGWQINY